MTVQRIMNKKQPWPYHHQKLAVSTVKGNVITVKVYCKYIPSVWLTLVGIFLLLVFLCLMGIAAIHWVDKITMPVRP